jgi:hypothetical protein
MMLFQGEMGILVLKGFTICTCCLSGGEMGILVLKGFAIHA